MVQTHRTVSGVKQATRTMTKSRFGAPSHMRVLRVATRLQPQRRLDTMLLRLHLLGTIRNKATNGACPHANVRGPYVRLPCTLPMPAARMRPCPIWPHAIQRNWTPSAPEMGPRFPMWNRDSLHARNSRVLSWTSITRRQAAGAYHQNLPLPAPPSHPSTFPGASLAEAAIRTTRRWDSSRGIISACICLHLPASPYTSLHLQSPTSAPVAALITAPILVPRGAHHGAVWPHVLMSSVRHRPPSAQPSRARRGRCSLQISHRRAAASR